MFAMNTLSVTTSVYATATGARQIDTRGEFRRSRVADQTRPLEAATVFQMERIWLLS